MHKQIDVGVAFMIALTAIGMVAGNIVVQQWALGTRIVGGDIGQQGIGNDPVGGDIAEQQVDFGILDKLTGIRAIKLSSLNAAAPIAISGDSVYIAWPANTTGNDEVMFRASNDGGTTFMEKVNLSNSSDTESLDVEIAADGSNVVVTWWERNATSNEPVARTSTDNGVTFGPLLKLSANGTIGLE
jgi:hypothetical protein